MYMSNIKAWRFEEISKYLTQKYLFTTVKPPFTDQTK